MIASNNWIHSKDKNTLSLNDKLKELIKMGDKIVLVQLHELERIKVLKSKERFTTYIEQLYNHYIVEDLPKTYLMSNHVC